MTQTTAWEKAQQTYFKANFSVQELFNAVVLTLVYMGFFKVTTSTVTCKMFYFDGQEDLTRQRMT